MKSLWVFFVLPALAAEVNYSQHARPILERRCQGCHQKGEIAPMAFTSYETTRPWAKSIREAVAGRVMPPWHADPAASMHFVNDRSLTEAEIRTLVAWVDGGAIQGPHAKPAAPAPKPDGWTLGKPDLIVRVPGFKVPGKGAVQYTFLVTPTGFGEDKWISAAEWKIDQRSVVHHMNAFLRPKGSSYVKAAPPGELYVASKDQRLARRPDEREVDRRELLIGYEPGYRPIPWGPVRGKLLPKGSDIVFEMHYNPNGTEAVDYSELGLYFAKDPPRERVLSINPADSKFVIPANDGAYESRAGATILSEVTLVSVQPHMHLRGKDYLITARYPDGRRETIIKVPKYDFNWQTTYFLAKPQTLPAGTVLECVAHFDNSRNNRWNPDPDRAITWGDQSWEEMNIGFMEIAFDAKRDPEVAKMHDTPKPAPNPASQKGN